MRVQNDQIVVLLFLQGGVFICAVQYLRRLPFAILDVGFEHQGHIPRVTYYQLYLYTKKMVFQPRLK